jgi:hypothetical protein
LRQCALCIHRIKIALSAAKQPPGVSQRTKVARCIPRKRSHKRTRWIKLQLTAIVLADDTHIVLSLGNYILAEKSHIAQSMRTPFLQAFCLAGFA